MFVMRSVPRNSYGLQTVIRVDVRKTSFEFTLCERIAPLAHRGLFSLLKLSVVLFIVRILFSWVALDNHSINLFVIHIPFLNYVVLIMSYHKVSLFSCAILQSIYSKCKLKGRQCNHLKLGMAMRF